jgi:GT2 family glycosyltransferase
VPAPTLAVVIPATDGPTTLDRCLAAIAAADDPPDDLVVVTTPPGAGPAEARNRGVAQTNADVVLFVDSDVLVHPDVLTRVRQAFASDQRLVGIFGSYDDSVATESTVAAFRNLLHHIVHQRSAGHVESFWAGIGAVRRTGFAAAGGFDADRYPSPSIEDVELGGRLARHGRILLDPSIQGTHLKEWSLTSMVRTDYGRRGVPWVSLLVSRRELPATLNLGARERASVLAALAVALGIVRRRRALVAVGLAAEVALNHDLLALLHERLGPRGAIAGVGLHTVHQLTAVAAVPAGLLASASRNRPLKA